MTADFGAKTTTRVEQFPLEQITRQGQYVNRKTGHLLVVDEQLKQGVKLNANLFGRFVSKDPAALEYVMVSENPHLSMEETRTKVASLSLPVSF
jgi:hypothetical protein